MTRHGVSRRVLLEASAGAALLPFSGVMWAARAGGGPQRLIVFLLRGAVDGLNVVVPYGENAYYSARPTIAIARPGEADGALALDAHFGLHPALSGMLPLWRDRSLAFIQAAGSPDPNRSHFEAQRYLENGTPGNGATPDGWMNRVLQVLPGPRDPVEALSLGPTLPLILSGAAPATDLPLGPNAARALPIDRPPVAAAFDRLYSGAGALERAYHEGRRARAELLGDLADEKVLADAGAPPPASFAAQAGRLARLIGGDPRIRLAVVGLGGWDTHIDQGAHTGRLANRLRPLGDGLAVLARQLGAAWHDTVIIVLSEFGRTVHENGDRGTDHGHGNVIWVAGGAVNGGQVYGEWPGLATAQLYQRRDLAVTTDFRTVLAAILGPHLRLTDRQLDRVFPGAPRPVSGLGRLFV